MGTTISEFQAVKDQLQLVWPRVSQSGRMTAEKLTQVIKTWSTERNIRLEHSEGLASIHKNVTECTKNLELITTGLLFVSVPVIIILEGLIVVFPALLTNLTVALSVYILYKARTYPDRAGENTLAKVILCYSFVSLTCSSSQIPEFL